MRWTPPTWICAAVLTFSLSVCETAAGAPGDPVGAMLLLDTGQSDGPYSRYLPEASIGMDRLGNSVVAWIRSDSTFLPGQYSQTSSLVAQRLAADGTRLGPEFTVTTARANESILITIPFVQSLVPDGSLQHPRVSMNANGQFIIAWTEYTGIHVRGYDALALPTTPEITIRQAAGNSDPNAVIAPDGSFAVSWVGRESTDIGFSSEFLLLPNIPSVETSAVHVLRFDPNGRRIDDRVVASTGHVNVSYRADLILDRYLGTGSTAERISDANVVVDDDGNLSFGYLRTTSQTDCDFDLATDSRRQLRVDQTDRRNTLTIPKVCFYDIGVDGDGQRVIVHPAGASFVVHRIPRPGEGNEVVTSFPATRVGELDIGVRPGGDFLLVSGPQRFQNGTSSVQVIGRNGQPASSPIPFVLDGIGAVQSSCRAAASAAPAYAVACTVSEYIGGRLLNGIYVQRYAAE